MSTFNAAVYDAVAVGLSESFTLDDLIDDPARVTAALSGYRILFKSQDFFSAVSGSVNDVAKVKARIEEMISYLNQ